ncbi:MAG: formate--phosphoribosylaminoimidazolecarboxamide ligase [Candidatus Altiarchaeota archaeon]|nr:formate--phosphoribosylaminoimidazolecarboxamide ligase [Candidatus Altiarchaeota archaeon]
MVAVDISKILAGYNKKKISIATLGSHSALNIFKGAKEEGLRTVCVCIKGQEKVYKYFDLADEFIYVEKFHDILNKETQEKLVEHNSIVVPHGSFNAYINQDEMENKFKLPLFGNRTLLRWEVSREKQHEWLSTAGLKVPRIYHNIDEIEGKLAFVKFPGAKGGKGYFVVDSAKAYEKKIKDMLERKLITKEDAEHPYVQEYIVGVSVYPHYFYSPLKNEIELLGIDKRYESSVDGIFRIPVPELLGQKINPSFTVVGNFPMVARESLLNEIIRMGERISQQAKKIAPPGCIGPFCLETIVTENLDIIAFEISARIVAGCNAHIGGNPYTYLKYSEPMYMGKRIAREVKNAIKKETIEDVVT